MGGFPSPAKFWLFFSFLGGSSRGIVAMGRGHGTDEIVGLRWCHFVRAPTTCRRPGLAQNGCPGLCRGLRRPSAKPFDEEPREDPPRSEMRGKQSEKAVQGRGVRTLPGSRSLSSTGAAAPNDWVSGAPSRFTTNRVPISRCLDKTMGRQSAHLVQKADLLNRSALRNPRPPKTKLCCKCAPPVRQSASCDRKHRHMPSCDKLVYRPLVLLALE